MGGEVTKARPCDEDVPHKQAEALKDLARF